MDDLIRRKDALQALKEAEPTVWTESDYELGQKNQYSVDELAIECVPSAEPGWVPVTERLPEKYQYVLVTYNGLDGRRLVVVANWNPNAWIESNSVAWMPVPEPYKEVGE